MLSEQDQLAIHRLVALYGYVIDERRYSRTEELFTVDAVYDVTQRGAGLHRGVEQIRSLWKSTDAHPLAHHGTNVVIDPIDDGRVSLYFKNLCVHNDGSVHSTTYQCQAAVTQDGWRISHLVAEMRANPSGA
ncbi:MAG TPA: nuclear transport factor 2 family protein [Streptosporangiaceae bacterium]|nr:nuclear transport factor 2 family protein [Streptosporangiaceae bacterium]